MVSPTRNVLVPDATENPSSKYQELKGELHCIIADWDPGEQLSVVLCLCQIWKIPRQNAKQAFLIPVATFSLC